MKTDEVGPDAVPQSPDFTLTLEGTARQIAAGEAGGSEDDFARDSVEEQLSALLARIDDVRLEHRLARSHVLELECEVGTDLLDTQAQRWWYSDHRMEVWRDRQRLIARRASLVLERVRTEAVYRDRLRGLQDRLLILVQRHRALRE